MQVARTLPEEELLRNLREDIAGCRDITRGGAVEKLEGVQNKVHELGAVGR